MENNDSKPSENGEKIIPTIVEQEMKKSYLDYAMSVIIGRALPDVRDGLKPVHRRILYAMNEMGLSHNKSFKKSASTVGDVLGKYHPHGDSAVYDTLVRMAQDFSLRYPLIKGQGNFGSVDGDNAAAMRYTEAKLSKISATILADIDKETVDTRPNFDDSMQEPEVLPTRLPNLLINGSNGIAVGMATNIPPHNLNEVANCILALLDNPEMELLDLMQHIQAPDYPTGAEIVGTSGILTAYKTGRGKVKVRSIVHTEEKQNRMRLVVTEIPYQVNKSSVLEQIAEHVRDKKIEGISDIRDESDRDGVRIVIELKKDANIDVVKNQLFKYSRLQTSYGINFLAIDKGRPKTMNLKEILERFIEHRKDVIVRRTQYDLNKAEKKAHILEGLTKALDHIDAVITLIKQSNSGAEAKEGLQTTYELSADQAQAILDMKLQKLTGLEQDQIRAEYDRIMELIAELKSILASEQKVNEIIKVETNEVKEEFGDERRTRINTQEDEDIDDEDLIPEETMAVTITKSGYAKRISIDNYKTQNRGGKGVIGATMKEEDLIEHLFVTSTHSFLLIVTDKGQVHWLKVYKIPEGSRQAKGKALVNLIQIDKEEHIAAVIPVRDFDEEGHLLMATQKGIIKKTSLEAYSRPRQGGIIGINLDEGDRVVSVRKTAGEDKVLLATKLGQAVHFDEEDARPIGRTSRGVRGVSLAPKDEVVDMVIANPGSQILTITSKGYGKRSKIEDYRLISRGGKGVRNIICNNKNGHVASVRSVQGNEELLLISSQGIIIRTAVEQISTIGRNTQGLRIMRLQEGDHVQTTALIISEDI